MKYLKISLIVLFLVIFSFAGIVVYFFFGASVKEKTVLYVHTGTDKEVLDSLLQPICERNFFLPYFIDAIEKKYPTIHAGKFTFEKGDNNYIVLRRIFTQHGEEVDVTFNQLDDIKSLASAVSKQIEADSLSIISEILDTNFLKANDLDTQTVKTLFIPNTYSFYWNTSAKEFIWRCVKEYHSFWNDKRKKKANDLNMTPLQVSILASIVQSESKISDDQRMVAGLYINRLEKKIRLQSDPTVIYAILQQNPERSPIYRVYINDLKIDSPYNTYKYVGLPPAPILIPEIGSLEAVLNSEKHKYIYMCADPERAGYHAFAENLSDHGKNRRAYIKWINSREIK